MNYDYLTIELRKIFSEFNFSWENKPTVTKIKPIKISIPIKNDGSPNLKEQKEIANIYRSIEEIKLKIVSELNKILDTEIDFD